MATAGDERLRTKVAKRDLFGEKGIQYTVPQFILSKRRFLHLLGSKLINKTATSVTSPQQPATIENLPEELLLNILIRLLAKQLAQMRSVSKSWNAILSESSFVKSHLNRSIQKNDEILLVFNYKKDHQSFTPIPGRSVMLELPNFIKLPVNPQLENQCEVRVIGALNGLICSSYNNDSIIQIWNPSLGAVLTLPPYSMPSSADKAIEIDFRFGYDPKTDDYKVLKLTGLTGLNSYIVECWLEIEIYSMRKGSWELITERFPTHIQYIDDGEALCFDGHDGQLHWYGGKADSESSIVVFDLGSNTFREIPLPDSLPFDPTRWNVLGVLSEKLCLCIRNYENDDYEVWVMEEYGVSESWVKRNVFSPMSGDTYPLGFTSHNEFLLQANSRNLVFFDLIANKTEIFKNFHGEGGVEKIVEYVDSGVEKIVEYVDSLVWVEPTKRIMMDDA